MFFPALQEESFFPQFAEATIKAARGAMNAPVAMKIMRSRRALVMVLPEDRCDMFLLFEELSQQCRGGLDALSLDGVALIASSTSNRSDALWLFQEFQQSIGVPASLLVIDEAAQAFALLPDILRAVGASRFVFIGPGVFLNEAGWAQMKQVLNDGAEALSFFALEPDEFEQQSGTQGVSARCFAWNTPHFVRWSASSASFLGGFHKENGLFRSNVRYAVHRDTARNSRWLLPTRIRSRERIRLRYGGALLIAGYVARSGVIWQRRPRLLARGRSRSWRTPTLRSPRAARRSRPMRCTKACANRARTRFSSPRALYRTAIKLLLASDREFVVVTDPLRYDHFYQLSSGDVWRQLKAILTAQNVRLVSFHHYLNMGVNALRALTAETGIPFVVTLHEFLTICNHHGQMVTRPGRRLCAQATDVACATCFPEHSRQQFRLRRELIKSALLPAAGYVAPSRFLADRMVTWGLPREKFVVIENGLRALPPREDRLRTDGSLWNFAYFGQITPFKGIDTLLDTIELLAKQPGIEEKDPHQGARQPDRAGAGIHHPLQQDLRDPRLHALRRGL